MCVCSDTSTNIRVGRSDILFSISFLKEGMVKLFFQLSLLILNLNNSTKNCGLWGILWSSNHKTAILIHYVCNAHFHWL